MSAAEMAAVVNLVAESPTVGVPLPGTGGCRKLRFAKSGGGQSGGYRVITFYSGPDIPVFLLTVFGKSEKANLTKAERNALFALTRELICKGAGKRQER
jgi:hypothetical protein